MNLGKDELVYKTNGIKYPSNHILRNPFIPLFCVSSFWSTNNSLCKHMFHCNNIFLFSVFVKECKNGKKTRTKD